MLKCVLRYCSICWIVHAALILYSSDPTCNAVISAFLWSRWIWQVLFYFSLHFFLPYKLPWELQLKILWTLRAYSTGYQSQSPLLRLRCVFAMIFSLEDWSIKVLAGVDWLFVAFGLELGSTLVDMLYCLGFFHLQLRASWKLLYDLSLPGDCGWQLDHILWMQLYRALFGFCPLSLLLTHY